ncbi:MAG: PIN domain-containing protein [Acidimicrobiaceae bacterium]|nr:PIN domain-containing protein [Acidimicrobiaceae bacterium]
MLHGLVAAAVWAGGVVMTGDRRGRRRAAVLHRGSLGIQLTTLVMDTHIVQWWSAEPDRLSPAAAGALEAADQLAVAAVTWYELAWQAAHGRITVSQPIPGWLGALAKAVRTVALTPAIAAAAAALPESFPSDPADRMIYATAIESGWQLVTKDGRMRQHQHTHPVTIW